MKSLSKMRMKAMIRFMERLIYSVTVAWIESPLSMLEDTLSEHGAQANKVDSISASKPQVRSRQIANSTPR